MTLAITMAHHFGVGAVEQLLAKGWLRRDERIVIFNTGAVQKYVEALESDVPQIDLARPVDRSRIT